MVGTISYLKLDAGYGFIRIAGGRSVFFHFRDLSPELPFDETLQERVVSFDSVQTDKGQRARNVQPAA